MPTVLISTQKGSPQSDLRFVGRGGTREQAKGLFLQKNKPERSGLCDDDCLRGNLRHHDTKLMMFCQISIAISVRIWYTVLEIKIMCYGEVGVMYGGSSAGTLLSMVISLLPFMLLMGIVVCIIIYVNGRTKKQLMQNPTPPNHIPSNGMYGNMAYGGVPMQQTNFRMENNRDIVNPERIRRMEIYELYNLLLQDNLPEELRALAKEQYTLRSVAEQDTLNHWMRWALEHKLFSMEKSINVIKVCMVIITALTVVSVISSLVLSAAVAG